MMTNLSMLIYNIPDSKIYTASQSDRERLEHRYEANIPQDDYHKIMLWMDTELTNKWDIVHIDNTWKLFFQSEDDYFLYKLTWL